jgi:uncharacterized membrane protein
MKYQISLVIAAVFIGLLIYFISYRGFGVESKQSWILAITASVAGLIVEWMRPLFKKKKAQA